MSEQLRLFYVVCAFDLDKKRIKNQNYEVGYGMVFIVTGTLHIFA